MFLLAKRRITNFSVVAEFAFVFWRSAAMSKLVSFAFTVYFATVCFVLLTGIINRVHFANPDCIDNKPQKFCRSLQMVCTIMVERCIQNCKRNHFVGGRGKLLQTKFGSFQRLGLSTGVRR